MIVSENDYHYRGMEWIAIPFAAATVVATFAGGALGLRMAHSLPTLLALTGGVVVAVALFDVLPEAFESLDDPGQVGLLAGVGFIAFFLAERVLVLHHRDEPEQARAHHRVGTLGALGLSAHSFVDGLGIGLAFGLDTTTGVLVFIAVISHDFADGLNTVSFVLSQSEDRRQAKRWLAIDAFAPLAGALVGSAIAVSEQTLGALLAVYAGFFLYMGGTDLLPEAHSEHASWARVALTVAGFCAILVAATIGGV
jgi:zinc transporter ZupT